MKFAVVPQSLPPSTPSFFDHHSARQARADLDLDKARAAFAARLDASRRRER